MQLDIQYKLKSNPLYIKYLHEHSNWYKTLNRDPSSFNKFIEEMKIEYRLRPIDKINEMMNTFDMLTSIMNTLNSN